MEVAGHNPTLVLHGKGSGKRLSARGRAHIQHPLSALDVRHSGYQTGSGVLHQEVAFPEGGQSGQISGAGQLQAIRHPRMHPGGYSLRLQPLQKGLGGGAQGIDLDGNGRRGVVGSQEGLRLLPPQQGQQPPDQPFGMAVPKGQCRHLVPIRQGGQCLFVFGNLTENSVDKARRLPPFHNLGQLHRLVDCGAVRDLVQIQDLVGPHPQDIQQGRLEMVRLLGAVSRQIKVQQHLVLQHAVDDPAAQGRVRAGETVPAQLRLQGGIRPGTVGSAALQHPQGRQSGRSTQSRPPPRLLRPRKISTNRSSCSADISSAAT